LRIFELQGTTINRYVGAQPGKISEYGASRAIGGAANNSLFSLPTISHCRQIITMAWKSLCLHCRD